MILIHLCNYYKLEFSLEQMKISYYRKISVIRNT